MINSNIRGEKLELLHDTNHHVSASPCTDPYHNFMEKMKAETEETFEFGIKIKGRNIFWVLYLTDKLSTNKGFTLMIGEKTIIDWTSTNGGKC